MTNGAVSRSFKTTSREGLSILEFVGCLSALIGGVVLGTIYLGVDVKELALSALTSANIISSSSEGEKAESAATEVKPEAKPQLLTAPASTSNPSPRTVVQTPNPVGDKPVAATPAASAASNQSATNAEQPSKPTDGTLTGVAEATEKPAPAPEPPAIEDLISLTDEQRRAITLAYWQKLDECMKAEVTSRAAAIGEDGNWQLFDYLSGRRKGHEQAAEQLATLALRGVDPHVSAYAVKALAWHRDGVKLFSRALDLLTDAPTAQLTGPFAQSWQSAATQHRMEEKLLAEKHQAVQSYLDHGTRVAEDAAVEQNAD